jgi:hypothetical protein
MLPHHENVFILRRLQAHDVAGIQVAYAFHVQTRGNTTVGCVVVLLMAAACCSAGLAQDARRLPNSVLVSPLMAATAVTA